ncbi:hypothetical protein FOA52_013723 [Chlamydomonas sp. UWO 241]|nr:hypothetical protein FOA52_013723 [Chlamydomonas sp. UWO 241]
MPPPPPDPVAVLRGHSSDVQALQFLCTPGGGSLLASGDITGVVRLWSLESLRPVATQQLHDARAGVLCLQHIAPQQHDGAGCSDGGGSSGITGTGDGGLLLSSGRDGSVRAWALREGGLSERPVFAADTGAFSFCRPHAVCVAGGAGSLGACGPAREEPWAAAAGGKQSDASSSGASGAPVSGAGWMLACAGINSGEVAVADMRAAPSASVVTLTQGVNRVNIGGAAGGLGMCMALQLLPGGNAGSGASMHILAGFEDGSLCLWDARAPSAPLSHTRAHGDPVLALAAAPRPPRARAAAAPAPGDATRADAAAASSTGGAHGARRAPGGKEEEQGGEGSVCRGSGGGGWGASEPAPPTLQALSGSAGDGLCWWRIHTRGSGDAAGMARVQELRLPSAGVSDVAFRGDGRVAAVACWDGKVRLYSAAKRTPLTLLRYHTKEVTCVRFAPMPQGDPLCTGSSGGGGEASFGGAGGSPVNIDGLIATASRDSTVALWSAYGNGS